MEREDFINAQIKYLRQLLKNIDLMDQGPVGIMGFVGISREEIYLESDVSKRTILDLARHEILEKIHLRTNELQQLWNEKSKT